MLKPFALFSIFIIICQALNAQLVIKGNIVYEASKTPVIAASIYVNNSSIGTVSDASGNFMLQLPASISRADIVISSLGYNTVSFPISVNDVQPFYTVNLKIKANELAAITLTPFEKDGWAKWGTTFLESFIGTSVFASNCKILNQEDVKFRYNKKTQTLSAIALSPLRIENKALGYELVYDLQAYSYDFQQRRMFYSGYPFFKEMLGKKAANQRWEKRRKDVYEGSMLHFMRLLYRNKLKEAGYELKVLIRKPNTEKKRIKMLVLKNGISSNITFDAGNNDSTAYYNKVIAQTDEIDFLGANTIQADSIAYAADSVTAAMYFDNYLQVAYTSKWEPYEYAAQQLRKIQPRQTSLLKILSDKPIYIIKNGFYTNATELLASGFWAWSEKIATMLPFDYWPSN